jgi:hypothetical protein
MTSEQGRLDAAVALIKGFVPAYNIKQKSGSKIQSLIGKLLSKIGNPGYANEFWTTVGHTTYRPVITDTAPAPGEFKVIMHEGLHALHAKKMTSVVYGFLYGIPQILCPIIAALVIGGVLSPWFLLVAAACLAPLPAPFRAWAEYKAYEVSLAADFWSGKTPEVAWVVPYFTGGSYYYMAPFKGFMERHFSSFLSDLRTDKLKLTPYQTACKELCAKFRYET